MTWTIADTTLPSGVRIRRIVVDLCIYPPDGSTPDGSAIAILLDPGDLADLSDPRIRAGEPTDLAATPADALAELADLLGC
jgi:hypothetical protein